MTHVHEDMGAYVLGALDADSERRVKEHLETCAECAAAHAELGSLPRLLDLAVVAGAHDDEPLPGAIEERVLDRFARERGEQPRRRWTRPRLSLGLSGLAGATAAIALLVGGLNFERNGGRPPTQYRVVFERIGSAPIEASARAGLRTSDAGTVLRLWVDGLEGEPGDVYEVMCDAPDWSVSAGTFRVDETGSAYVVLTAAVKRGDYDAIRIVRRANQLEGKTQTSDILGATLQ